MPDTSFAQSSFLGGEWSARMQGRMDDPRYKTALSLMQNYQPTEQAACERRSGFIVGGPTAGAGLPARLVDWRFNTSQAFVSEFTNQYMRLWQGGTPVIDQSVTFSAISQANPAVITFTVGTGDLFGPADEFIISFAPGSSFFHVAPELVNRRVKLVFPAVSGDTEYTLLDAETGNEIDGSAWTASPAGTIGRVLQIVSPYLQTGLEAIRKIQSSDTASTAAGYSSTAESKVTFLNGLNPPQSLSTIASISDGFIVEQFIDGPYLDIPDKQAPLQPNARSGTITITYAQWQSGISYNIGDVVYYVDTAYISIVDSNLGHTPPGSLADAFWAAIPLEWTSGTNYTIAQAAVVGNLLYFSLANSNTGNTPGVTGSTWWSTIAPQWSNGTTYGTGDCVVDTLGGGGTYIFIAPGTLLSTTQPSADATHWSLFDFSTYFAGYVDVNGGLSFLPEDAGRNIRLFAGPAPWDQGKTYATNDLVTFEQNVFQSQTSGNTGNEPDLFPTDWVLQPNGAFWTWGRIIAGGGVLQSQSLNEWVSSTTYTQGTVVVWGPGSGTGGAPQFAYVSLKSANTNNDPNVATLYWRKLTGQLVPGPAVTLLQDSTTTIYNSGDTVDTGGGVYVALYDGIGGPDDFPGSTAHWLLSDLTATTTATGSFIMELVGPPLPNTNPIYTWQLGLYCASVGFPTCGTYHEGRVWLGGVLPNRFDGGVPNMGFSFSPTDADGTVTDASAISYTLNAEDQQQIEFMASTMQGIVMGTQGGEWLVSASSLDDPLTPTSIQARKKTSFGCYNREPLRAPTALIVIHGLQKRLLEYRVFIDTSSYTQIYNGVDMTRVNTKLSAAGVNHIAFQQEPTNEVWGLTNDNNLFGIGYKNDPDLRYTAPHSIVHGDPTRKFSGLAVQIDDTGINEQVYVVTYAVNPFADNPLAPIAGSYRVEVMAPLWDPDTSVLPTCYMDGAIQPGDPYTSDENVYVFSGLQPYIGQTVTLVLAGCYQIPGLVVDNNGSVTITLSTLSGTPPLIYRQNVVDEPSVGIYAYVGFPYASQGQLLRPAEGAANGPAFGKTRRHHYIALQIYQVREIKVGTSFSALFPMDLTLPPPSTTEIDQDNVNVVNGNFQLTEGVFRQNVDSSYDFDGMLCWEQDDPFPGTVTVVGGYLDIVDV